MTEFNLKKPLKIVSFNVNGIRARLHQLAQLAATYEPDIIGLQEIKVDDEMFPLSDVEALGYHVNHYGQKGHYGVAILSKVKPTRVVKGLPGEAEDAQRRAILCEIPIDGTTLTVFNGYFPQGESRDHPDKFPAKRAYYAGLQHWLETEFNANQPLVLMGDMNVAPMDIDIGIGADNMKRWLRTGKCCFLPEEREWLNGLLSWGLVDSYRSHRPEADDVFSWFDYRSKGFEREPKRGLRIDFILMTNPLMQKLRDVGIAYDIRAMEKPSDHCPVWVELA